MASLRLASLGGQVLAHREMARRDGRNKMKSGGLPAKVKTRVNHGDNLQRPGFHQTLN